MCEVTDFQYLGKRIGYVYDMCGSTITQEACRVILVWLLHNYAWNIHIMLYIEYSMSSGKPHFTLEIKEENAKGPFD